jgi:hypothetical protein
LYKTLVEIFLKEFTEDKKFVFRHSVQRSIGWSCARLKFYLVIAVSVRGEFVCL